MLKKTFVGILAMLVGFAAVGCATQKSSRPEKALTGKERFYELRIYTAAPGKMEALHTRFRDHTLAYFKKHGIRHHGYWTAVDEKHQGKLYFVVSYPDAAGRDAMLVNGVAKDPGFLKAVAESEKDGKLTVEQESVLLTPTDYSPMK